ncbi:hypothetical protein F441_16596 [Phytophthora nicotianae CJ01A1]|uniref:Uncharacterized protein n=2 Tax=Phytophthora nicotianae TaxID=4792 RepID=V9EE45_PHYNI|nr:hypothetical protein F443_16764 [Phytophthora nicotianae P1569]ETP07089.1 hypothetical protein F441_16596 [Phytophthora nicotianae CJ01A1]
MVKLLSEGVPATQAKAAISARNKANRCRGFQKVCQTDVGATTSTTLYESEDGGDHSQCGPLKPVERIPHRAERN